MAEITGVGNAKLERYGEEFITAVKAYIDENPEILIPEKQSCASPVNPAQEKITGETVEKTFDLLSQGHSVEKIAEGRNLAESTITGHIEQLIIDGREIDMTRLVERAKQEDIGKLFLTLQSWQLKPVIEHFKGSVSYEEAKYVRAFMRHKSS